MKTILSKVKVVTGLGTEVSAYQRLSQFIRYPANYLNNPKDTTSELVDILTLLYRILFLWKTVEVVTDDYKFLPVLLSLLGAGFLLSRQISWILLWVNSFLLNSFFRLLFRSGNLLAAQRAYTYSIILPGAYYLLLLGNMDYLGKIGEKSRAAFIVTVSVLILFGLLIVISYLAEVIIVKKLYCEKFWKALVCSVLSSTVIFIISFFAIIIGTLTIRPFYVTEVITEKLDHNLLNFQGPEIDTSIDGSRYMLQISKELIPLDTTRFLKIMRSDSLPESFSEKEYSQVLGEFDGLFKATYFNKNAFDKELSEFSTNNDSSEIDVKYPIAFRHLMLAQLFLTRFQLQQQKFLKAIKSYEKGLYLCKITSQSRLDIVSTITAVVVMNSLNKTLSHAVSKINDTGIIEALQSAMVTNQIQPYWLNNIINIKHRAGFAVIPATYYMSRNDHKNPFMKIPGAKLVFDLLYDIKDTKAIHDQFGIRVILNAKDLDFKKLSKGYIPELDKMKQCLDRKDYHIFYKNPIGRILVIVSYPVYAQYIRNAESFRRHGELTLHALAIRKYLLQNGRYPKTLEDVFAKDPLMAKAEFLYNETLEWDKSSLKLTNTDSVRFEEAINYQFK